MLNFDKASRYLTANAPEELKILLSNAVELENEKKKCVKKEILQDLGTRTEPRFYTEFEAVPNGLKYSGQSVREDGTTSATRWTAYFDGKDYPVTGDPASDTISLKRVDRFNTEGTFKKAGKVISHVMRVVSQDGKVWTLTTEGTDAQGKPYSYVLVFDKK